MECGSLLPLLHRERFPSSVLSAVPSTVGPAKVEGSAKVEALAKQDARRKAAASPAPYTHFFWLAACRNGI